MGHQLVGTRIHSEHVFFSFFALSFFKIVQEAAYFSVSVVRPKKMYNIENSSNVDAS